MSVREQTCSMCGGYGVVFVGGHNRRRCPVNPKSKTYSPSAAADVQRLGDEIHEAIFELELEQRESGASNAWVTAQAKAEANVSS